MSPLSEDKILDPDTSLTSKIVAWLVNQGPVTVLMFLALYKSGEGIDRIYDGYARNAKALQEIAVQRDVTVDKVIAQWREDRDIMIDLLRGIKADVDETSSVIRHKQHDIDG